MRLASRLSRLGTETAFAVLARAKSLEPRLSDLRKYDQLRWRTCGTDYLLAAASVATLAGTSFGAYGEGFLRLPYATSIENLNKALDRIDVAIRKLEH